MNQIDEFATVLLENHQHYNTDKNQGFIKIICLMFSNFPTEFNPFKFPS